MFLRDLATKIIDKIELFLMNADSTEIFSL